jgi:hypothetical protein
MTVNDAAAAATKAVITNGRSSAVQSYNSPATREGDVTLREA